MIENCQYSIRLINRLKELDQNNQIDYEQVDEAIYWAKKYHGDQKRKSGEPYYTHPLEVAYMVAEYNLKTDVIVAAILHDIVEDTEVTFGMILDNFNARITQMVDRLTRDRPDGTKWSVEQQITEAIIQNDKEILFIKAMDRVHNLNTISYLSSLKKQKKLQQTVNEFILLSEYLELPHILIDTIKQQCEKETPVDFSLFNQYRFSLLDNSPPLSLNVQNVINLHRTR